MIIKKSSKYIKVFATSTKWIIRKLASKCDEEGRAEVNVDNNETPDLYCFFANVVLLN